MATRGPKKGSTWKWAPERRRVGTPVHLGVYVDEAHKQILDAWGKRNGCSNNSDAMRSLLEAVGAGLVG